MGYPGGSRGWGQDWIYSAFGFRCFAFVWDGMALDGRVAFLTWQLVCLRICIVLFSSFFAALLAGFEIDGLSKDILLAVCNITFL